MAGDKKKYKRDIEKKIQQQFSDYIKEDPEQQQSIDYAQFKADNLPPLQSTYGKLCSWFGAIPAIDVGRDLTKEIKDSFTTCHMSTTSKQAISLALYGSIIIASVLALLAGFITLEDSFSPASGIVSRSPDIAMVGFLFILGLLIAYPLLKYPKFLAEQWRMKAGNQMVLAVFYIVTYMRHTSNLERAIEFSSDHIGPPLALDFRKILWDVETETFESISASLENYLLQWRGSNDDFIEAMHLIQSSLLEDQEDRRLAVLDKSLDIILSGTYEKMLHYAHNLQGPITTLHMLGVIMPILGLVLLPLVISFIPEVRWYHIALIYNVLIPVSVYYMGSKILAKRPSGYGGSNIDENNPELIRRKKEGSKILGIPVHINPALAGGLCIFGFLLLGFFPIWIFWIDPSFEFGFGEPLPPAVSACERQFCFLDYHESSSPTAPPGALVGPFGLGASIASLLVPLGLGLGLSIYFALQSMNVIEIRRETEQLESEFGSALFQLGNRLDDGLPAEAAVGTVSASLPDTVSGNFFKYVYSNVQRLGISLEESIFNKQIGALVFYPSNLIESSMKVLIQSARKGPRVAAQALSNISRYLKEMHLVNERLQDLMAEVLSSMTSQINFLLPIISGIVIGITSMITNILSMLTKTVGDVGSETGGASAQGIDITAIFSEGLPTFYFQIIVGLYAIQIVYILSIMINGVRNGVDPLEEKYLLAHNLFRSTVFYIGVAAITMIIFNFIAVTVVDLNLI